MSNLHDARVEAAADAINNLDWTQTEFGEVPHERDIARAALAAADAVVTVEMIAEALHGDECPEDPDEGESCGCDGDHYMRQGEIVISLLRGGEEQ